MKIDDAQILGNLLINLKNYDQNALDTIEAFINRFIEKQDLYAYIQYIDFYHTSWNNHSENFMSYNPITKTININCSPYENKEHEANSILSNFYFIANLLHELYHVKERKISEEEETLKAKLLKLCFKRAEYLEKQKLTNNPLIQKKNTFVFKYLNSIYNHYYLFDLSERLAFLYSYHMASLLAKNMGLKELERFWKLKEYDFYTFWHTHKSPTLFYLEKICTKKELNQIREEIESIQIPLEERIHLGLELTPKEFEHILEKKIVITNSIH